jgi:putative intracellular protease/amidase
VRWLYHLVPSGTPLGERYAPASLASEGFVHASFKDTVEESARVHFPAGAALSVLQIDPRRLDARVTIASTPRGPMPHVGGSIPRDAVRATLDLGAMHAAPDGVTGTRFALVAFDGMTLLDLVGMLDPLSRIATMKIDVMSSCEVVGATGKRVWASDGAELNVVRMRPPLNDVDVLLVAGGASTRVLERDAPIVAWLAAFPHNRIAASVCTGALLLGAAGRLHGRRATTHHTALARLAEFGATAVHERVVDDGQLITAGGVTSGIDLGLHLVTRLYGDVARAAIAKQMEWR